MRGVPNRSLAERWRKLRRRRPGALSRGVIVLVLAASALIAVGSIGFSYRERIHEIDSALAQGRSLLARHQFKEAGDALKHGLSLANHLPGSAFRRAALEQELAIADRGVKIDELHRLAELIRFRYGLALPPEEEARSLIRLGRRDLGGPRAVDRGRSRTATNRRSTTERGTDLMDLIVLWAELRGRYRLGRRRF